MDIYKSSIHEKKNENIITCENKRIITVISFIHFIDLMTSKHSIILCMMFHIGILYLEKLCHK